MAIHDYAFNDLSKVKRGHVLNKYADLLRRTHEHENATYTITARDCDLYIARQAAVYVLAALIIGWESNKPFYNHRLSAQRVHSIICDDHARLIAEAAVKS